MKRTKKPVLLTDVDGVVVDWVKTFGEFVTSKGFTLQFEHPQTWGMTEWFNASANQITELITEMNSSEIFARIPIFPDAQKVLPQLAEKYDLVAITSCSNDALTIARRKRNLEMIDVKFKEVHCLNFNESKKDWLKSYPTTVWVEDRFEGAECGVETGHKSILINRPYNLNQSHQKIIKVDSWYQIQNLLKAKS
jgi:5'(3')-deoxyribonucleotidase